MLLDPTRTRLEHRFSVRYKENVPLKHDIPVGTGLVGYAARERTAVLVPDVQKDERYIQINPETRSELAVPLIYKGSVIGVLAVWNDRRETDPAKAGFVSPENWSDELQERSPQSPHSR